MDIVSRLPFALGRAVSGSSSATAIGAINYDFALGDQGFLAAMNNEKSYVRSLVPERKDQFDSAREAGEQSLANWWMRSQASFIGGEGILYQDPDQVSVANLQNRHTIQYGHSVGLNPWVNGKLTLLRSTAQRIADTSGNDHYVVGWDNAGTPSFWSAYGANLKSDDGTTTTTVTYGGANAITSLASDGTHYFAADSVGIWSGTGTGAGAKLWDTGSASVVVAWVKGRLMAGIGNKLYSLDNPTGAPTLPTPLFTHLNSAWTWTSFAEGTNAIYASGKAGNQSQIYKLTLDTTGDIPALASGGQSAAQMPMGEVVQTMYCYLGTFLGIGTNRGFRVGQIDGNGDIVYGPLIIPTSQGVQAIAAYDRFFFVGATNGIEGDSGLWRVDLSQPIYDTDVSASLRFAYATDLQTHLTGRISSATNFGSTDQMVIGQVGRGAYLESATVLEPTGYFLTGRIRYNTLEPKLFKFLTVRTPTDIEGTLASSIVTPQGTVTPVFTIGEGRGLSIMDIALSQPAQRQEWVVVRLDFTRSTLSTATGPEVNGWQMKALPGATRQRQFVVPLMCFDRETDRNGQWDGYEGRTLDRLQAFERLAQRGDSFTFTDLNLSQSWIVIVDDYQFEQKAAPGNNANGYGGYLTVQLHTVADVVN